MRKTIVHLYMNHSCLYLNKFVLIPKGVTPKTGSSNPGEIDCCPCFFASIRPINTIKECSAKSQKKLFWFLIIFPRGKWQQFASFTCRSWLMSDKIELVLPHSDREKSCIVSLHTTLVMFCSDPVWAISEVQRSQVHIPMRQPVSGG